MESQSYYIYIQLSLKYKKIIKLVGSLYSLARIGHRWTDRQTGKHGEWYIVYRKKTNPRHKLGANIYPSIA